MTTTACASGCGRESADASSFLTCSKCKSVRYCNKTCQVEHWKKGGHKYECFAGESNARVGSISFGITEKPPHNCYQLCREAMHRDSALCSIFLGRNENHQTRRDHPYMILTDRSLIDISSDYAPIDDRLVLPKVPPALVDPKNRTRRQGDLYHQADASGLGKKLDVCQETTPEDFQKLLAVHDTVWTSMFRDDLNETVRGEILQFIDRLLKFYQWSCHITVPQPNHESDSDIVDSSWIVGKKIGLGGGIEAVYLTAPGLCLADLCKSEKAFFGVHHYHVKPPLIRAPASIYLSKEEGWYFMPINRRQYITAQTKISNDAFSAETTSLKVFLAGAEIGDLSLLFSEIFESATTAAFSEKQERIFASAVEKLIELLHPHHKWEQAFFLLKLGEVYESLASRLLKDRGNEDSVQEALLSAALTYKAAADLTRQFYPFIGLRLAACQTLAVTLMRLGDFEMAARACIWAHTDPDACHERGAELLHQTMVQVWEYKLMSVAERAKSNKKALKAQREQAKATAGRFIEFKIRCNKCHKVYCESPDRISRCQRCRAPYCSRACQKSHWKKHRDTCTPVESSTESFEKYTHCPDETRAMLTNSGNVINKEFGMSLADWSRLVDQYNHVSANQQILHPEAPASLMTLIYEDME